MLKIVLLPVLLVMTESDESFTVFIIPCHSCLDYETRPRCTLSFDIYYLTSDKSLDFILLQNRFPPTLIDICLLKVKLTDSKHVTPKGPEDGTHLCCVGKGILSPTMRVSNRQHSVPTHVTKAGRLACGLNVRDSGSLGVTSAVFALLCLHCCVY